MSQASEIAAFFQDPDASSAVVMAANQIAAPLVQGATLTADETVMGGGLRVVFFILDASPSMEDVADGLRNGFNNDFVPAVRAAREDDISALRVGGTAFSSGAPKPIWVASDGTHFHPFNQLPELTAKDYDPNRGWGTALHRAILDGTAQALKYVAELQLQTGMDVDVDIVILTDGANNEAPRDASQIYQMITGRDKTRVRYVFFYFQTDYGLGDPKEYATDQLGIDGEQVQSFMAKPGETPQQRAARFRALMQVLSKVSAARNTSAVVATSAVLQDEELI
ncbi:MAG TPA: hypothetical protein VFT16_05805 [Candidatus Saccharimonadales bacterium]|nr:hypothetical protein [Candidatus Saccharimonadales bacterium]